MKDPLIHRIVGFSVRRSWVVILIAAALTAFLGYYALQIQIDADIFNMIPSKTKVIADIERYSTADDTGQILIAVEGEDLFDLKSLQVFDQAIRRLEADEAVLGSINPFNFLTFQLEGRKLRPVTAATEGRAPHNREELETFKERLLSDPLAKNMVLSADQKALCAIFPVEFSDDYSRVFDTVMELRTALEQNYTVYITGSPIIMHKTKTALLADVPKFLIFSIIVILAILYVSFRALRSLALPLIVVGLGTLWTMGTMRMLGFSLTVVSIMVPPLVLTLGSAYSIHILNQYYREAKVKGEDKSWIAASVGHINQTILLAALTTIIGFSSLVSANLSQIREFGLATSIGIVYCALLSLFFFPAILRLLPPPKAVERDRVLKGMLARFMESLSGWVVRNRYFILAAVVLIAIGFTLTLRKITYQTDYLNYYREKQWIIRDSQEIVKRFGGYSNVYITIEAPEGEENYFLKPEVLKTIASFEEQLQENPDICYLFSFTQYLKLMNLKLTGRFAIPDSRAPVILLSRYMKTIINSPYGRSMAALPTNENFTQLTIFLRTWHAQTKSLAMEPEFKALMQQIDGLVEAKLTVGSERVVWGRSLALLYISETLSRDQVVSIAVSLLFIFLVTAIGFRSIRFGLLTLIPMLTGIMLNFIIMVALKLPFDVVTVMFSSVAIGVGIDDSIHLIIRYRRQIRIYDSAVDKPTVDKSTILAHTLKTTGRPILLTSMSLVAGLLVLCFSQFLPILYFGILVSLALTTTTIGALVILPAILSFGKR
jgi:hydrophobe/amphiphile efflux-3 (HAE3) family protein